MDDSVIIDDYYGIYPSQWDYQKPQMVDSWDRDGSFLALPHQVWQKICSALWSQNKSHSFFPPAHRVSKNAASRIICDLIIDICETSQSKRSLPVRFGMTQLIYKQIYPAITNNYPIRFSDLGYFGCPTATCRRRLWVLVSLPLLQPVQKASLQRSRRRAPVRLGFVCCQWILVMFCYIATSPVTMGFLWVFLHGFPTTTATLGQREAAAAAAVAAGLSPMEVVKAAGHAASAAMKALGMTAVEQAGTMVRTKCHGAMVPWCHGGIIILL